MILNSSMKRKSKFVKSAFEPKDYPTQVLPEIVITGRSNAGKSSLINAITGASLAKVSQTPGKTRLINFFEVGPYMLVDMPGYGYASRSGDEVHDYKRMVESYFSIRSQVTCLILVMDARRDWSAEEEMLRKFAYSINKPLVIVATKLDKMNQKEKAQRKKHLVEQAKTSDIFFISSTQRIGVDELEESVYRQFIQPILPN